jgi:hypothetical protein
LVAIVADTAVQIARNQATRGRESGGRLRGELRTANDTSRRGHPGGDTVSRSGLLGSRRPLSAVIRASKTASTRHGAAAAPIRLRPASHPVAQPIGRRPPDPPSRRRHRQHGRGEAVFPRREAGAPAARFLRGGVRSGRREPSGPRRPSGTESVNEVGIDADHVANPQNVIWTRVSC